MKYAEACHKAKELNKTGKHRDEWDYRVMVRTAMFDPDETKPDFYVVRFRKFTDIQVAVFRDGSKGMDE